MENKDKKRVTNLWLETFFGLSNYAQNKLFRIVGPFVYGIELVNLPRSENYRPQFVIYPLFKGNIKTSFKFPLLMFEFYDSKGLQLNLPYNDSQANIKKAQDIVMERLKNDFNDNVSFDWFNNLIDQTLSSDPIYKSNSGMAAALYEIKFFAALYGGNVKYIQYVLNEIKNQSESWNMKMFETWHGNFGLWFETLQKTISSREGFLKQIEMNKKDKKMLKLKNSEITV